MYQPGSAPLLAYMTSEIPQPSAEPDETPAGGPLPFAVTGPTDLQVAAADRTGRTTFTVTNLTGRPVRVRLQPKSSDASHDGWYKVAGDTEVPMPVGGTITVDVLAKVPSDVPEGKDSLHLRAVDEADPEQLTDGQPLAVTIPAPPPPPKKRPFVLIAVIALVVLLTGGTAIWWFLLRSPDRPVATKVPTISGNPLVGQTLTATPGTWSKATTTDLQWYACSSATSCTAIAGATTPDFVVTSAQAGAQLKVTVTATGHGGTTTADSELTAPVGSVATNTTPPTISGSPLTGQLLTATTGVWTGATSFAAQWYACTAPTACTPITGATGIAFQLTPAQAGTQIKVTITATGTTGSASADSPLTTPVRVVVPNVIGFTVVYTRAVFASYGLNAIVQNDPFNSNCSIVTVQNPGAGSVRDKGATVSLFVSLQPPNTCLIVATFRPTVIATYIPVPQPTK